jgi:hypothetical protein
MNLRRLCVTAGLLSSLSCAGQKEHVQIRYNSETKDTLDKWEKKYNYLIRAKVEEKTLIKAGLSKINGNLHPSLGFYYLQLEPRIGIERKLVPAWSLTAELSTAAIFQPSFADFIQPVIFGQVVNVALGIRNYFNMESRMNRGVGANNFSANYFSLLVSNPLELARNAYAEVHIIAPSVYMGNTSYIKLGFGMQRRIGRLGFVDVNIGPEYHYGVNAFTITNLGFFFGFGL